MRRASFLALCFAFIGFAAQSATDPSQPAYQVFVVMSYEESFPWDNEIREGIESVLAGNCQIEYFYLNTKVDWQGGASRAKEAFARYQLLKPDGVIAADDDAQSMFVVPYLRGKSATPVIFCGVNGELEKYGYPASNVTGVNEREPMKESLLFLRELVPTAKTFAYISKEDPTGKAVERQLIDEKETYPLEFVASRTVRNMDEATSAVEALKQTCDALLYITLEGLPDASGKPLTDKEIIPELSRRFGKPVFTNAPFRVRYGALCAVVKTGQEHGELAAEMLLKAMQGTPVAQLPVTQNRFGRRIINVNVMNSMGITPKPSLIRRTDLVRTEE